MARLTEHDRLRRIAWRTFLTPLVGTGKPVAIARLDETLAELTDRSGTAKGELYRYLDGTQTVGCCRAFAIGEALRRLGIEWCNGPVALYAARHVGDFLGLLGSLTRSADDAEVALRLFEHVPLVAVDKIGLVSRIKAIPLTEAEVQANADSTWRELLRIGRANAASSGGPRVAEERDSEPYPIDRRAVDAAVRIGRRSFLGPIVEAALASQSELCEMFARRSVLAAVDDAFGNRFRVLSRENPLWRRADASLERAIGAASGRYPDEIGAHDAARRWWRYSYIALNPYGAPRSESASTEAYADLLFEAESLGMDPFSCYLKERKQ